MKTPLIRYRILIQFLEDIPNELRNLATFEDWDFDYKKAKKIAKAKLKSLALANKQLVRATIEPELLEENLLN